MIKNLQILIKNKGRKSNYKLIKMRKFINKKPFNLVKNEKKII